MMVKGEFQDLESPLTFIPVIAGMSKTVALLEALEAYAGSTLWVTARNRITAVETGRPAGAEPANVHTVTALRERIATGDGPKAGDILVVDEFSLLDHAADDSLIQRVAESGVIVNVLVDLRCIQGEK